MNERGMSLVSVTLASMLSLTVVGIFTNSLLTLSGQAQEIKQEANEILAHRFLKVFINNGCQKTLEEHFKGKITHFANLDDPENIQYIESKEVEKVYKKVQNQDGNENEKTSFCMKSSTVNDCANDCNLDHCIDVPNLFPVCIKNKDGKAIRCNPNPNLSGECGSGYKCHNPDNNNIKKIIKEVKEKNLVPADEPADDTYDVVFEKKDKKIYEIECKPENCKGKNCNKECNKIYIKELTTEECNKKKSPDKEKCLTECNDPYKCFEFILQREDPPQKERPIEYIIKLEEYKPKPNEANQDKFFKCKSISIEDGFNPCPTGKEDDCPNKHDILDILKQALDGDSDFESRVSKTLLNHYSLNYPDIRYTSDQMYKELDYATCLFNSRVGFRLRKSLCKNKESKSNYFLRAVYPKCSSYSGPICKPFDESED